MVMLMPGIGGGESPVDGCRSLIPRIKRVSEYGQCHKHHRYKYRCSSFCPLHKKVLLLEPAFVKPATSVPPHLVVRQFPKLALEDRPRAHNLMHRPLVSLRTQTGEKKARRVQSAHLK